MSVNDYRKQVRETSEPDLSTNLGRLIASAPAAPVPAESIECGNCFEGKSDGDHICRSCNGTGEHATAGNATPTDFTQCEWCGHSQPSLADADFKNFHRLLCERFGYAHDDRDWKRDQLSLIEFIASKSGAAPSNNSPVGAQQEKA